MPSLLAIVLPAWNESAVIEQVLREILNAESIREAAIHVIDDGSTDGTPDLVQALSATSSRLSVSSLPHGGKDRALWHAFRTVESEWIAILDADGQYVPDNVAMLLAAAQQEGADACWGRRERRSDHPWRLFCSRIAKGLKRRALGGLSVEDAGCGIWVARVKYLKPVAEQIKDPAGQVHCHLAELIEAQGGRVTQRPIQHRSRAGGTAKFGMWNRLGPGRRSLQQARDAVKKFRLHP